MRKLVAEKYFFKTKAMKKIIILSSLLLPVVAAFTQSGKNVPPAWGHYKKLASYNGVGKTGMEAIDTLRFVLAEGETRVTALETSAGGGPSAPESKKEGRKKPKASACDPEACQPGELIGNGRKRTPHYLGTFENFSLAPPPANSSEQTRAELDYLLQLQQRRGEEDIRASLYYAGIYYRTALQVSDKDYPRMRRNLFHIGRSIGPWFNADSLPLTAQLAANVWKDAEYYIWKYKNYFVRIRPYKLEPRLENLEETNWAAYPSGHATNSYVNAFLFSQLLPEFTSFFMKDAYDMAYSREIIGVHYPSDSESGRLLAFQLVKKMLADETFKKDLEAARAELKVVQARQF